MYVVRDEWINLSLHGTLDKEEVEAGVKWMYYASNLKEPKVVFVEGINDFVKKFGASVRASVRASVGDSVGDSVRASVGASVRALVWDSVRASVWASVRASVGEAVRASVWDSVWDSVSATSLCYDSDDMSFADYFIRAGILKPDEKTKKYIGYLKGGAFYAFFFEKVAFVMCPPSICEQDEQKRLDSTTGPALAFPDGTELYFLRGVKFDKKWWTKVVNDKFKPEEVFAIDNLEHRRIAYEFMDKTKMKKLNDYKILDEVTDSYGNPMKIVSFSVKNVDEPLKYLNVFCPSTKREYFIGTDKDTCIEAKNSSFGLEGEVEYIKEW